VVKVFEYEWLLQSIGGTWKREFSLDQYEEEWKILTRDLLIEEEKKEKRRI
jgi:hypothetical protein